MTRRCDVTVQTEDKQQPVVEDQPIPENPEVIIFASYAGLPKAPVPISKLAEMVKCNIVMHHYLQCTIFIVAAIMRHAHSSRIASKCACGCRLMRVRSCVSADCHTCTPILCKSCRRAPVPLSHRQCLKRFLAGS